MVNCVLPCLYLLKHCFMCMQNFVNPYYMRMGSRGVLSAPEHPLCMLCWKCFRAEIGVCGFQ